MDLICKADETFHTAWNIANSSDWKEERRKDNGDIVESKILHGGSRKSFKVTVRFNHSRNRISWSINLFVVVLGMYIPIIGLDQRASQGSVRRTRSRLRKENRLDDHDV